MDGKSGAGSRIHFREPLSINLLGAHGEKAGPILGFFAFKIDGLADDVIFDPTVPAAHGGWDRTSVSLSLRMLESVPGF
jgi:hypothetical protein